MATHQFFNMGSAPLTLALAMALALIAGANIVHGSSVIEDTSTTGTNIEEDSQCSTLKKRQDLLDSRMNERDSRLDTLDTCLSAQINRMNTRLNGMDAGFDRMETEILDMKDYLKNWTKAINEKWAPRDQEPSKEPLVLKYAIDNAGVGFADGLPLSTIERWPTTTIRYISSRTRLLAFNVTNYGGPTGVVASVSNGVMTDMSAAWKCSQVYEEGWNQIDFDDGSWGSVDYQDFVTNEARNLGIPYGALKIGCRSRAKTTTFYFRRML